ncbi:MAG TPA: glycoside hydrolase family 71 protein [Kofleriaceae bacterium]|jgi:hypothetical protein
MRAFGLAVVAFVAGACKHTAGDTITDAASSVDAMADAAIAAAHDPCKPFAMPSADALFASTKKVFAHYFYPFPLSIDNKPSGSDYYNTQYLSPSGESDKWLANGGYLRARPLAIAPSTATDWQIENMKVEVRMAIAAGISGFTVDVLGTDQTVAGSQLQNLLAAAAAVDPRFAIVVMPDVSALGSAATASTLESIIASVATSPSAYHLADGRLVASAFDASLVPAATWSTAFADLAGSGIDVAFVPTFLGWQASASAFASVSYGFADWGTATPASAIASETAPAAAQAMGKIFMSPVDPEQYRPKDFIYWEAGNSAAFRDAWTSAITGGADWIQLVTWSDFSESSVVEPYTDATLAGDLGTGYYDLTAYYATWFLTGAAPVIDHDVLYYFYRREPVAAADPNQATPTTAQGPAGSDRVELVGFLTAPGTLEITFGSDTATMDAPAGVTSFSVPLQAGVPQFGLSRGSAAIISAPGPIEIAGSGGLASGTLDLTYWSGSVSSDGTCQLQAQR